MKEDGNFYFFSLIQSFFFNTLVGILFTKKKKQINVKCEMWMQWLRVLSFFFTVGISLERMILQLSIFLSGVNAFERIWFVFGKKRKLILNLRQGKWCLTLDLWTSGKFTCWQALYWCPCSCPLFWSFISFEGARLL